MIVKQILLVSPLGNLYKTVWRICILILGWKEIKDLYVNWHFFFLFRLKDVSTVSFILKRRM